MDGIKILGIAGSLRRGSFNQATLRAAESLLPANTRMETFARLGEIPPFNEDDESSLPEPVADLKVQIRDADAILFVTPEYNYSIPGVLKNAIDWASRPYGESAWSGKPVAVMGASMGIFGSARAQYHLRQAFVFLDMHPVNTPEVMIPSAHEKFDDYGNLTDETSRELIGELLERLVEWTHRLEAGERLAAGARG